MPAGIPESVERFIRQHIGTIAQLELLLLLRNEPERTWSVDDAAKGIYTAVSMTGPLLDSLRASGLLVRQEVGFQYAPASGELEAIVAELAQLYAERRVSVINVIYSATDDKLQSFADAFRLRRTPKKEEN
jgi:hypothetical protein